jgi:hypothetical protein
MNKLLSLFFIYFAVFIGCEKQEVNVPKVQIQQTAGVENFIPETEEEINKQSLYGFENEEYFFEAYYSDLKSPPFRFSFYEGIFYMDIPELDYIKSEVEGPIKGTFKGEYTIHEENGFVYILVGEKKFLVLHSEDLVCVLIDCENNDAFFGVNKKSEHMSAERGILMYMAIDRRSGRNVSSFLTETGRGETINYDGSHEKYFFELTKPWVEGVEGQGMGEWLETYPVGNASDCDIVFFNVYIDPNRPDLYYANSRIKEVTVTSGQNTQMFQIQDTPNFQILSLPDGFYDFYDLLRFTIKDIYEGSRYTDTCLAGIYFLRIVR